MGLVVFRQSSSDSAGGLLLYSPKITPVINLLYGGVSKISAIPVIRSGVNNKVFYSGADTDISLLTYSSAGAESTVASISFTTYLASSNVVAYHLNSADTCLYVLLYESPSYQIIKIDDTTGVVTSIGTPFTPTTAANWPLTGNARGAGFEVDTVSGHLKLMHNGFTHLIHKTTGAIVSQDVAVTLGAFLAKDVFYVTQDGSLGLTNQGQGVGIDAAYRSTLTLVSSTYGILPYKIIPHSQSGAVLPLQSLSAINSAFSLVDNDKVCLSYIFQSGGASSSSQIIYSRTEFDKYLKSCADFSSGTL